MATITSVGTGAWSASGTWDSGVPADGDDVVIASGHTVTFDVDQSAFVTGVNVTITGTLTHTTATGTYCLFAKTGASINGGGTWNIGTSGTPIPFASKHTIKGASGWYVSMTGTINIYGTEPTIKYLTVSGSEAKGQTEIGVNEDVTGDIWAEGDTILIGKQERIIAAGGISSDHIDITVGLTEAVYANNLVCLRTRNITFIGYNGRLFSGSQDINIGSGCVYNTSSNNLFYNNLRIINISGGIFHWTTGTQAAFQTVSANISGGIFIGVYQTVFNTVNISGGVFASNYIAAGGKAVNISGGLFTHNAHAVDSATALGVTGGTFQYNTHAISLSVGIITGGTFTGNTRDLNEFRGKLDGISLTAATEHYNYRKATGDAGNCQSTNHDGVANALMAWCGGGTVASQATVVPSGYALAYIHVLTYDDSSTFFTKAFTVEAGETIDIEVQLRKDSSMTTLPSVYLMNFIDNPMLGETPVDSLTMTDSIDTWETDTFSITNSTDTIQDYTLWFVAKGASGNVYSAYKITTTGGSGGGGAVSIQPLSGRLGL